MICLDTVRAGEVGDGPADLDGTVETTARKRQTLDRLREEVLRLGRQRAGSARDRPGQMGVARHTYRGPSAALPVACILNPCSGNLGRLTR